VGGAAAFPLRRRYWLAMADEDVDIVRRCLDAFNRRDRAELIALCHDDAEVVPLRAAIEDTVYRGPGSVARFWDQAEAVWEGLRVDIHEIAERAAGVLVLGRLKATTRATGTPVEASLGWVFEVRGGLLWSLRTFSDPSEAVAAAEGPDN
jgi:ketosteroid isomerase-like protein